MSSDVGLALWSCQLIENRPSDRLRLERGLWFPGSELFWRLSSELVGLELLTEVLCHEVLCHHL